MTLRQKLLSILFVTLAATACGANAGDPGGSPSTPPAESLATTPPPIQPGTAPSSSTTQVPTTTTIRIQEPSAPDITTMVGGRISGDGWWVEPGTYSADLAGTSLRVGITGPAAYLPFDGSVTFGLPGTGGAESDLVDFTTFVGIIAPDFAGIHPDHDKTVPDETTPIPENLTAWFDAVPQVQIEAMSEITGPSATGFVWDIKIDDTGGQTFPCQFGNCIASLVSETWGPYVMGTGAQFRIWQFTGDGEGIFGFMQAHPARYDETSALADMLLAELKIEDSGP